mgnify:CR=1 FL=1
MPYNPSAVSGTTRILFPIFVTIVAGTIAPKSAELIGFLMFGNLIRECGVLGSLSASAQNELANLITLVLGISVSFRMKAEMFVTVETLVILLLGLVASYSIRWGACSSPSSSTCLPRPRSTPWWGRRAFPRSPCPAGWCIRWAGKRISQLPADACGWRQRQRQIASVIAGGLVITLVENALAAM